MALDSLADALTGGPPAKDGAVPSEMTASAQSDRASAFLAAIVATADDAIISKTLDGHITSWNAAAERMFGYAEAEVLGRSISLIIPSERLREEEEILSRLKRGSRIEHFETVRVAKDGRRVPISLSVSPVVGADGEIIGASKIARNISERLRFEREREELFRRERLARAEAQVANRAKDQFLAMLAHELRNPVGVIMNAVAVLDEADAGVEPKKRARHVIRRQVEHLAQLLDDLLDVARITGGRIDLEHVPVDLGQTIEQAVDSARTRFDTKAQRVNLAVRSDRLTVVGDSVRLLQVFGNLLHNAWKYTPPGGTIDVTLDAEGEDAVARVRDSGAGIPPDMLDAIFEFFVQANPSLARTEGGLGIGLSMVKRLVELHGGTVEARSAGVGLGAEFVVRLPRAPQPAPTAHEEAMTTPATVRRILVVEDNTDGRDMLVTMLRLSGHDVRAAATGAEGIDVALREHPSVVLLDIGLPDLDGYQVGHELRRRLGDAVRLVAVTGYGQPQDRARTAEAGFDAHLVKPVDLAQLTEILEGEA